MNCAGGRDTVNHEVHLDSGLVEMKMLLWRSALPADPGLTGQQLTVSLSCTGLKMKDSFLQPDAVRLSNHQQIKEQHPHLGSLPSSRLKHP